MSHSVTCKTVPLRSIAAIKAAVAALIAKGVNVELKENAKPRGYYNNQIKRQLIDLMDTDDKVAAAKASEGFVYNSDPDICDFVIHCPDAHYDVGLIKHEDGHYVPYFDNYEHSASDTPMFITGSESGGISKTLGTGKGSHAGHWNGLRDSSEAALHSIGSYLQEYTKCAAIEAAIGAGHMVDGCTTDEDGNMHLTLSVS
tara:strand:+ start:2784 stop:3383 length:600 start_codon:yes stop_codon:yes gene_type:complete